MKKCLFMNLNHKVFTDQNTPNHKETISPSISRTSKSISNDKKKSECERLSSKGSFMTKFFSSIH